MFLYDLMLFLTRWPLALMLFIGGVYFTIRTRLPQIRLFKESIRVISEKPKNDKSISSFGALMISTASRVGTGNVVGVSTAICLGGAGAVFWMWITAILGSASAIVESTLAQIYKKKDPNGGSYGGPSYYIEIAFRSKVLAVVFAVALIITYGIGYNMLASYNIQSTFSEFAFYNSKTPVIIGAMIALLSLYCLLGGGKRIARITEFLVPIMGVLFVLLSLVSLCINYKNIPGMFGMIFEEALDFHSISGGVMGSCLMYGFKRGLYSNEAGMGSAPNAAAAADVSHPVKQGLVQMLSVFIDTLLLCTATAFMCLSSGVKPTADSAGALFVQEALKSTFGSIGPIFIAIAMLLFAFTTILGNFYYIENCFAYLCRKIPSKKFMNIIRIAGAIIVFAGALVPFDMVWNMADICQFILAFINIPVCMGLGNVVYRTIDDYCIQRKAGKEPEFKAKTVGIKDDTDFWN